MPRSKATAKLEPQTHASDERGRLYRDQDSYRKKKERFLWIFEKENKQFIVTTFSFFSHPVCYYKHLRACYNFHEFDDLCFVFCASDLKNYICDGLISFY